MHTNQGDEHTKTAASYEQDNVHDVYAKIASHFSETRYKPWPVVDAFIKGLPPGSIGLDIGCGNGKYLMIRNDIYIIGSDRSRELIDIAKKHDAPHSAIVADCLNVPHGIGGFDFAISIAVVHHLSTRERRVQAIRAVLDCLKETPEDGASWSRSEDAKSLGATGIEGQAAPAGALFFVWALEQKASRRGWDEDDNQDVLVPWVLKPDARRKDLEKGSLKPQQQGYSPAGMEHVGRNDDQTFRGCTAKSEDHGTHVSAPLQLERSKVGSEHPAPSDEPIDSKPQTYHRYYHLYVRGELEEDIVAAGGRVLKQGYDRDNWWAVACRTSAK